MRAALSRDVKGYFRTERLNGDGSSQRRRGVILGEGKILVERLVDNN
jgi:hypothetical protein